MTCTEALDQARTVLFVLGIVIIFLGVALAAYFAEIDSRERNDPRR